MLFWLSFLAGIANFTMQKAVFESGHPVVEHVKRSFGPMTGERFSLILDTVLLAGVMMFVWHGNDVPGWLYLGYTGFNAAACWAILTDRF